MKKRPQKPLSRNQRIAVASVAIAAIGIVVSAILHFARKPVAPVERAEIARVEEAEGVAVGDHATVTINRSQGIDEDILIAKIMEASEAKGRVEVENHLLREQVANAVRRVTELKAGGNRPDVEEALDELRKNGDTTRLRQLLIRERDKHRNALIQRNCEIAAVAYYRGDMKTVLACSTEVLTLEPNNLPCLVIRGIGLGGQGRLAEAKADFAKAVGLAADAGNQMWQAIGQCNLGATHYMLGELDQAEDMFNRSLDLNRDFKDAYGMATCYAGLGLVLTSKGDLKHAEEMQKTALNTAMSLDARDVRTKYAVARQYGWLGMIYVRLGKLDDAEAMYRKALAIHEETGNTYDKGNDYHGLGQVDFARGELDKAERLYQDALKTHTACGDWNGVAYDYAGLGNVYYTRGELDKAEGMYAEALKVSEVRGLAEVTATVYVCRGVLLIRRGDLDQAEVAFNRALKMSEPRMLKLPVATAYSGLAEVYERRGDAVEARGYWARSLNAYREMGEVHMVEKVQRWIDALDQKQRTGTKK